MKYSNYGLIQVKPVITFESDGRLLLKTTVSDQGIGLSSAECSKIFTPFALLSSERRKQQSHCTTGIGLSICKQICLELGGDLTVESVVGHGSAFTFTIKVQEVDVDNGLQKRVKKIKRTDSN